MNSISIKANIAAPLAKVWEMYNLPKHIQNWNFAHESWHCPYAKNDLVLGGKFSYRMEAKNGSFGFDLEGVYTNLEILKSFSYTLADNRNVSVKFKDLSTNETLVEIDFEPETTNSLELQEQGWQAILNNFKQYAENNLG